MAEHIWRFFRAGGFDQVCIDTADDIRSLGALDQKLWVALACPVNTIELDAATLKLIDGNGDGRVRATELIAAVKWACDVFADPAELTRRLDGMPLGSLSTTTDAGKAVLATARRIAGELGDAAKGGLKVADAARASDLFAKLLLNGDGIVPPAAVEDADLRSLVDEIIATVGSVADRGGEAGVDRDKVKLFFDELGAFAAWWDLGNGTATSLAPLGDATAAAGSALAAVRAKIDDWFTRCELAEFDARSTEYLAGAAADWAAIADRTLSRGEADIAEFPLAAIGAHRALPLTAGVNPAWRERIEAFRTAVVTPVLGARDTLTSSQWRELCDRLGAYEAWQDGKKGAIVEKLGIERVRELLSTDLRARLEAIIDADAALKPEADALRDLEKAARFYRDLHRVLDNFVSFRDFYGKREKSAFQAGTLYLDGRSCDLCIRVEDAARHGAMAGQSQAYLAYLNCVRRGGPRETMAIAAAFTDGDSDYLMVGRNGIFYDRNGDDWDATITSIVENPISIRQAFWSPYKRVAKLVSEQIEKFAASKNDAVNAAADARVAAGAESATTGAAAPAAAPAAFDIAKFAGIFAAMGLALGVIGTALASLVSGFLGLRIWQMPLAIMALMLIISGPSMLLAGLKLRQRNLAPLLDASGWAINARARINIPFGRSLTAVAELPKGAERSLSDPYKEKKQPWWLYVLFVVAVVVGAILWDAGLIQKWTRTGLDAATQAPAAEGSAAPEAPAP
jgi:hypothetical protein